MGKTAAKRSEMLFSIPLGLIFTDIAYKTGVDPVNVPKFWVLAVFTAWALADIGVSRELRQLFKSSRVVQSMALILFIFILFYFVAFMHTAVKSVGLLGSQHRQLGLLNYLFLSIIGLYAALKFSNKNIKYLYWTGIGLGFVLATYGFFQHFKIDFIPWSTPYNSIILFTGNPDFSASLLGLLSAIIFSAVFLKFTRVQRSFLLGLFIFLLLIIYWTKARQGLIATLVGFGIVILVVVWQKYRKYFLPLLGLEFVVGILAIFGSLKVGPLANILYKGSLEDRGYDWRAAVGMFRAHPWFGVGVDSYSSYFFQYRAAKYPLLYGYSTTVNNAHNVFLNHFATAGIFVGLTYIGIILFIAYRALVLVRVKSGDEQIVAAGIIAAWVIFICSNIISVDVLSISIWGWVLGGAIVGMSLGESPSESDDLKQRAKRSGNSSITSFQAYRVVLFCMLMIPVLFFIVLLNRNNSNQFKLLQIPAPANSAQRQGYLAEVQSILKQPLMLPDDKVNVITSLARNNYGPETVAALKDVLKEDSRNSSAYLILSLVLENLKMPQEAIFYRSKFMPLNPYGADNMLSLENDYLNIGDKKSAASIRDLIVTIAPGTPTAQQASALLAKSQ
jgi:hypothetical protein